MTYRNYNASNRRGALQNFEGRRDYEEDAPQNFVKPTFDLWSSSYYYGRINEAGDAVFLSEAFLKPLSSSKEMYALNFVSEAFLEWIEHFTLIMKKKGRGEALKSLKASKAWTSIHDLYHTYTENKFERFTRYISQYEINKEIKNFNDFMEYFLKFNEIERNLPVCRSSFISSKYCNPFVSGMVISLETTNQSDDSAKQRFISEPDFELYTKTLSKFGFRVNKNAPWVIIADLKSKYMKEKIKKFTEGNLYDDFFYAAWESDMEPLRRYLIHYYNGFVFSREHPTIQRDTLSSEAIHAIPEQSWLIWYSTIKINEANYLG
jgi:hypothetical protein